VIPIPVDSYRVLFLQYRDHLHRWAVPSRFTVALAATRCMDMTDGDRHLRRKPGTDFAVYNLIGEVVDLRMPITELKEGDHLAIIRKEEA
jgi:hypothetical protein